MFFHSYVTPKMLVLLALFSTSAMAQSTGQLYDGHSLQPTELRQLIEQIQPGTVVVLGENHGQPSQQMQQMEIINALKKTDLQLSVGLEFMWYTDQPAIDAYRSHQISEADFLRSWRGGYDFDLYKPQLTAPIFGEGFSLGLNLPQPIASKIGKLGLAGLTQEDWTLMPPNFTLGRDSYKKRFIDQMGGHGGPNIEKYFAAQSAWDDTMAWRSIEFLKQHPEQILVIVVGEFHVQYGGGLPDRLRARLALEGLTHSVVTVSQVMTFGMTDDEVKQRMQPSAVEGSRADFILLDSTKPAE